MAVVNIKSNLIPDRDTGFVGPDPEVLRGRLIVATGSVSNGAADSNTSKYHLVDLPADCILHAGTAFDVELWGFATVSIGTETDVDALVSVLKSAGNTVSPIAFGDANHGKRLWEVLGLAAAPASGVISLWAHAIADTTGAGSMPFAVHYLFR